MSSRRKEQGPVLAHGVLLVPRGAEPREGLVHLQDDGPELLRRQELLVLGMEGRAAHGALAHARGGGRALGSRALAACRGALGERARSFSVLRGGRPALGELCDGWRSARSRPRALAELIFLASSPQNLGLGQTPPGQPDDARVGRIRRGWRAQRGALLVPARRVTRGSNRI